jgi:hypothetical protein
LRTLALSPRSGIGRAHQFTATRTVEFDGHATLRISDPPLAANESRSNGPMIAEITPILRLEGLNAKIAGPRSLLKNCSIKVDGRLRQSVLRKWTVVSDRGT